MSRSHLQLNLSPKTSRLIVKRALAIKHRNEYKITRIDSHRTLNGTPPSAMVEAEKHHSRRPKEPENFNFGQGAEQGNLEDQRILLYDIGMVI